MDGGAWRATVNGVAESRTQLSDSHTHTHAISSFTLNQRFHIYICKFQHQLQPQNCHLHETVEHIWEDCFCSEVYLVKHRRQTESHPEFFLHGDAE